LPGTADLRREQIKLQVGLANALMHTKGYGAPDTKASFDRAQTLMEQAEMLGESPKDPLLLFSVLYGFWVASNVAFNGDVVRELAARVFALAERQGATIPLMLGHRLMGVSLMLAGDIAEARPHLDRAITLYDPAEHRPLAVPFGQLDVGVASFFYRSLALWCLGYPDAARADTEHALKYAYEIGQAVTLMSALAHVSMTYFHCGDYATANAQADELVALADEKGSPQWKSTGMLHQGLRSALTGEASDAIQMISSGITGRRSTGTIVWLPLYLPYLARAHAERGQFDDAWRRVGEAMRAVETTKERWCETEVHRTAGEIALMSPEPDAAKAEVYFARALAIAQEQKAKSWELRAAMSMARLWRDQGKRQQACDLLAPVYSWFTEGFDTLDLRQAKALLEQLTA